MKESTDRMVSVSYERLQCLLDMVKAAEKNHVLREGASVDDPIIDDVICELMEVIYDVERRSGLF